MKCIPTHIPQHAKSFHLTWNIIEINLVSGMDETESNKNIVITKSLFSNL